MNELELLRPYGVAAPKDPKKLAGMFLHYCPTGKVEYQGYILKVSTERKQFAMQCFEWLMGYENGAPMWVSLSALEAHAVLYLSDADMNTAYNATEFRRQAVRAANAEVRP